MELAAVRVRLPANLCAAYAARVVILVAIRQHQEQCFSHRVCPPAARAEETGRFEFAKTICHAAIVDYEAWGAERRVDRGDGGDDVSSTTPRAGHAVSSHSRVSIVRRSNLTRLCGKRKCIGYSIT